MIEKKNKQLEEDAMVRITVAEKNCIYYYWLLFILLGRLFNRVDLLKLVSNVHPSVCLYVCAYVRPSIHKKVSSILVKCGM